MLADERIIFTTQTPWDGVWCRTEEETTECLNPHYASFPFFRCFSSGLGKFGTLLNRIIVRRELERRFNPSLMGTRDLNTSVVVWYFCTEPAQTCAHRKETGCLNSLLSSHRKNISQQSESREQERENKNNWIHFISSWVKWETHKCCEFLLAITSHGILCVFSSFFCGC